MKFKSAWEKFLHRKKLALARKGITGIKAIGLASREFKAKGGHIPSKPKSMKRNSLEALSAVQGVAGAMGLLKNPRQSKLDSRHGWRDEDREPSIVDYLAGKLALEIYGKPFLELSESEQDYIYREIQVRFREERNNPGDSGTHRGGGGPYTMPIARTMHRAAPYPYTPNPNAVSKSVRQGVAQVSRITNPIRRVKAEMYGTGSGYPRYVNKAKSTVSQSSGDKLVHIYDKCEKIFVQGSANSGSYGIRRTDKFVHSFTSRPEVLVTVKSGTYYLPKGSVVLRPRSGDKPLLRFYGTDKQLSQSPVGSYAPKSGKLRSHRTKSR